VLIQTGNQAVSISERVQLDCPVVGGDPPPMILWTKNDQPVEISGRIQQLANGSLAIYDSSVSAIVLMDITLINRDYVMCCSFILMKEVFGITECAVGMRPIWHLI